MRDVRDRRRPDAGGAARGARRAKRSGTMDAGAMTMTTTATTASDIQALEARHVLQTYKRQPVVFVRGEGVRIEDIDGRRYLDFVSGIGVSVLGHGHPGLSRAWPNRRRRWCTRRTSTTTRSRGRWRRGWRRSPGCRARSSATAAPRPMEACLKFARRFWFTAGRPRAHPVRRLRARLLGPDDGRAVGDMANAHYREPFGPLVPGVTFVPGDIAALDAAVDRRQRRRSSPSRFRVKAACGRCSAEIVAAIDARVRPHRRAAHRRRSAVRARTHRRAVLLPDARPDARPDHGWQGPGCRRADRRGAGRRARWRRQVLPGDHGTTYGGNLLAMPGRALRARAAQDHGLLAQVRRVGAYFEARPAGAGARSTRSIARGAGRRPDAGPGARPSMPRRWSKGRWSADLLVNRTAETVVRLLPPSR